MFCFFAGTVNHWGNGHEQPNSLLTVQNHDQNDGNANFSRKHPTPGPVINLPINRNFRIAKLGDALLRFLLTKQTAKLTLM